MPMEMPDQPLRSEDFFRTIFDLAAVGMAAVFPKTGKFILVNKKLEQITGFTSEELQNKTFSDITHPEDRSKDMAGYFELISGKRSTHTTEKRYIRKDGRIIWVHNDIAPIRNADGQITHTVGIIQDITETREAQQKLRKAIDELHKSQERFRTLTDMAPDGIYVQIEDQIVFANNAFAQILGAKSPDEIIGKKVWTIFHPDFHATARERFTKILSTKQQASTRDQRFIKLNGSPVDVSITAAKIDYQDQVAVEVIVRDITDRKENEKKLHSLLGQLREAISARDTLIGIASHELKNPLTALSMMTGFSKRQLDKGDTSIYEPKSVEKFIKSTDRQVDRLIHLVNDMLDITQIASGQLRLNLEQVDLSKLTQETVERMKIHLDEANCALELHIEPSLFLKCDKYRIEQVLVNLISNAVKYAPGKKITISLQSAESKIILSVQDEGPGIEAEKQTMIFQRFERAVEKGSVAGLGLGLYISRQIIAAHSGSIRVESTVGQGSSFIFELPTGEKYFRELEGS